MSPRMKHHFNVYVDAVDAGDGIDEDRKRVESVIRGFLTGTFLLLDRGAEILHVETFDADKEERGGE